MGEAQVQGSRTEVGTAVRAGAGPGPFLHRVFTLRGKYRKINIYTLQHICPRGKPRKIFRGKSTPEKSV